MTKTMQDYGILDANEELVERATQIFFDHRRHILLTGKSKHKFLNFAGVKDEEMAKIEIEDKDKYQTYHANWIEGILKISLRHLNLDSNFSRKTYDPAALAPDVGKPVPPLDYDSSVKFFIIPESMSAKAVLLCLGFDISQVQQKQPEIEAKIKPHPEPAYPQPDPPSPENPDFQYTDEVTGLKGRQKQILDGIKKSFNDFVQKISDDKELAKLSTLGPVYFYQSAGQLLIDNLPPPGDPNLASTAYANYGALISTIVKPFVASALGVIGGSSESGVVGGLGAKEPDQVKTPVTQNFSKDSIVIAIGMEENTSPPFRRKLFNICKELKINADALAVIIANESAASFSPSVRSGENIKPKPGGGKYTWGETNSLYKDNEGPAVGLIQFTSIAIKELNQKFPTSFDPPLTKEVLGKMTAVEQLDVVKLYIKNCIGTFKDPLTDPADVYIAIFLPQTLKNKNKPVLATKGDETKAWENNKGFRTGDEILRQTFVDFMEKKLSSARLRGRIYCDVQKTFKSR
jgi:hypothetical protein